jgi:hypothetical protein
VNGNYKDESKMTETERVIYEIETFGDYETEFILKALKEKQEREKGCKFCNDKDYFRCEDCEHAFDDGDDIICDIRARCEDKSQYKPLHTFCSCCGRKLGGAK